jgi:glucose 1-dehydrogenase
MTAAPTPWAGLVTGAAGGIGQAICWALVAQARRDGRPAHLVAAASRPSAALDTLLEALRAGGATATAVFGDLTDPAACRGLVQATLAQTEGRLDTLVSNAGASVPGALADLAVEAWDASFALNVRATWLLAQAARAALSASRGSVVAIASMSGLHPHPGYGAYSPAKAALVMLCRQLAQEWSADGIRVNAVCPGMVRTPLTEAVYQDDGVRERREQLVPLGRIGTADDIGGAVAYLASAAAGYVTGQALTVDGGLAEHMLSMIPGRPRKVAA